MAAKSRSVIHWDVPDRSSPLASCVKWRAGRRSTGWSQCASAADKARRAFSRDYRETTMATAAVSLPKTKGCAFLIEERTPQEIFTPEDLTEEHRAIARAADEFWNQEVAPNLEEIIHGNHDVAVRILKKSAELGLTAILTPERYGGMELDLASAMIAAEHLSRDGSYSSWHGAHSGIGTTPLLLFGTEE